MFGIFLSECYIQTVFDRKLKPYTASLSNTKKYILFMTISVHDILYRNISKKSRIAKNLTTHFILNTFNPFLRISLPITHSIDQNTKQVPNKPSQKLEMKLKNLDISLLFPCPHLLFKKIDRHPCREVSYSSYLPRFLQRICMP